MTERNERALAEQIRELIATLTPEEQSLMASVVQAEREKLHLKKPRDIQDDLWRALTGVVK